MDFFRKISVLHKHELSGRLIFFVKSHTGFLKLREGQTKRKKAKKINIFSDKFTKTNGQYSLKHYSDFTAKLLTFKENKKPWYRLSVSSFNGDIREYWEFNRLQFLNIILNKYLETNDPCYLDQINHILNLWLTINPPDKGYCHISNLEIAIRSIVFYRLWYYLSGRLIIDLEKILFIYGSHLYNDLPRTNACNPNNHSLGEAVSLYFLSRVFENQKWERLAFRTISKRIDLIASDGNSKEESSGYLFFKAQMLVFLRNLGSDFDSQLDKLLPKIIYTLNSITDDDGNIALFGDCDDGLFYAFSSLKKNNVKQLSLNNFANYKFLNRLSNQSFDNTLKCSDYLVTTSNDDIKVSLIGGYEIGHGHNQCLSIIAWENNKQKIFLPGTFRYNDISFKKRQYYCGLKRQNCPRSTERNNLITKFRHKKIIKKVNLCADNILINGYFESKNEKISRKVILGSNFISVSDVSNKKLKRFSFCCDKDCVVKCKNGLIEKETDLFSISYGTETLKEYITIIPSCNRCDFIIEFKK